MSYHNTNRETGVVLAASEARAATQEDQVRAFFESHPGQLLAPHEVHEHVMTQSPLTSVRRAMTNLTNRGVLEKTSQMETGTYDKQVHRWRLRPPRPVVVDDRFAALRARLERRVATG